MAGVEKGNFTMRRPTLISSLLLVAFVLTVLGVAPVAAAGPRLIPVNPDDYTLPPHALVGSWLVTTDEGAASFIFEPDGSVVIDYPFAVPAAVRSVTNVSLATGTWRPVGTSGVSFRAEQTLTHATGAPLGAVIIEGFAVLDPHNAATTGGQVNASITVRDAQRNVSATTDTGAVQPVMTASRLAAGPVAVQANDIYDVISPIGEAVEPAPAGRGCNTCR